MFARNNGLHLLAGLLGAVIICFVAVSGGFAAPADDKNAEEFMGAVDQGDVAKAQKLFATVNPNFKLGGKVPLLLAVASSGQPAMVKMLLDKGANVNAADPNGETPLMAAVSSGNPEIVSLLLNKGADVQAKDKEGFTALKAVNRYLKIRELLLKHGAKE